MTTMGQFSNGTEGDIYREQWCDRCIHDANNDCPVWNAHLVYAYRDKPAAENILNMLIPRSKDGLRNKKCRLFIPDTELARARRADTQYQLWREDHQGEHVGE
jgi:hypothetical protein